MFDCNGTIRRRRKKSTRSDHSGKPYKHVYFVQSIVNKTTGRLGKKIYKPQNYCTGFVVED